MEGLLGDSLEGCLEEEFLEEGFLSVGLQLADSQLVGRAIFWAGCLRMGSC